MMLLPEPERHPLKQQSLLDEYIYTPYEYYLKDGSRVYIHRLPKYCDHWKVKTRHIIAL
jgi:hypothetical protein